MPAEMPTDTLDGHQTVDADRFREGMSRVAGAVHVVATRGPAGRAGFTATAVTAVSDHPPSLLVCANAGSESARSVIEAGIFSVNTLGWEDEPLASVFAGRTELRGDARFADDRWRILETGAPILDGALVAFDCRVVSAETVGTHHVVIGAVVGVRIGRGGRALVYRDRRFQGI